MKNFELTRKKYLELKKCDHKQMQDHFHKVYEDGYQAGVKDASAKVELPDLSGLEDEIQNIRGVGGAKARTVCTVVKGFLGRKADGVNEASSEISGK